MRRSGTAKFPSSVELFKFCQRVLADRKGSKVHDQEVGSILNFNPSDCSHWKRGEKNIKSVFALEKLADFLKIELGMVHDIAGGISQLDEAYFEYQEAKILKSLFSPEVSPENLGKIEEVRTSIDSYLESIHQKADFSTPPLYLPEVLRLFPFISIHPMEMMDKLSRVLRKRPGEYAINFQKGELRPQTRMSIASDLSRILLEGERERISQIPTNDRSFVSYERAFFVANLLVPREMLAKEIFQIDFRKNLIVELAAIFWVPKILINFQLQDIVRYNKSMKSVLSDSSTRKEKIHLAGESEAETTASPLPQNP